MNNISEKRVFDKVAVLMNKTTEVEIPPNQLAMINYYNEKIGYLRDAIKSLEGIIKEYEKGRKSFNMYGNFSLGGKHNKRRKTRKMKKL